MYVRIDSNAQAAYCRYCDPLIRLMYVCTAAVGKLVCEGDGEIS